MRDNILCLHWSSQYHHGFKIWGRKASVGIFPHDPHWGCNWKSQAVSGRYWEALFDRFWIIGQKALDRIWGKGG